MATFKKGINGAFSGKVGSTVGASWRQIDYIRSLPKPSKKPATPRQLAQRARFALAVSFLQPMKWLINIGFQDQSRGRSTGFNQGMQRLIRDAVVGDYPDFAIDYPRVSISAGNMEKLLGLTLSATGPSAMGLAWTDLSTEPEEPGEVLGSYPDDRVFVLLYNRTEHLFTSYREATRQDESLGLELPAMFAGHEIHVWAFVRHRDGLRVSSSQYAGSLVVGGGVPDPDPDPEP